MLARVTSMGPWHGRQALAAFGPGEQGAVDLLGPVGGLQVQLVEPGLVAGTLCLAATS
jgi:hypothetical protein